MKYFIYLIAIIILLGINIGLFKNLQIYGQMPNLLFLLALCASLEKKDYNFFYVSLIGGLFLDFYSTGFFGAFTLAFLTVSLCAHFFSEQVLSAGSGWKTLTAALLSGSLLLSLLVWLYNFAALKLSLTSGHWNFKEQAEIFLPALFYNLLLLYPIYALNNFLRKFVDSWYIKRRGVIR
jgi:cell shape-determining protein MreD